MCWHLGKAHSVFTSLLMKMFSNADFSTEAWVLCSILGASWMKALWSPGVQPKVVPSVFNPPNNLFHQIVPAVSERPFPTCRIWQLWVFPTLARIKIWRWKEKPWYLGIKFLKFKTIRGFRLQRSVLNCTMNLSAQEQQSVAFSILKKDDDVHRWNWDPTEIQVDFSHKLQGLNWVIPNVSDCNLSFTSKPKERLFTGASLTVNKITLSRRSQHL